MTTFDSAAPGVIGDEERFRKSVRALIVVDVQNDFITGSLAVDGAEEVAHRIAEVLPRDPYVAVALTQDWHFEPGEHWSAEPDYVDTWPVHARAHTFGAELHEELIANPFTGVAVETFHKGMYSAAYSGFEGTANESDADLATWLREQGVTEVDIVGIATDYCVKATALDAIKYGFTTRVLIPYTAAVAPESNEAARKEMTEAGVTLVEGDMEI